MRLIPTLLLLLSSLFSFSQAGSLVSTFGTSGKVTTSIGSGTDRAEAMAIQTDGKIVVVGYSHNGTNNDFALARYNTDGLLDGTFGTGGKVTTAIGTSSDFAYAIAIQGDGKIVVAGTTSISNYYDFALARYNTDGLLDGTFGTGGKVTTAIGTGDDFAYALAIQSDGKIVAAGNANNAFALARYSTNGSLDGTFGTGGKVTTAIGSSDDKVYAIAVQSDGKIVAAGYTQNSSSTDPFEMSSSSNAFALARYSTNGSLDGTFGTGGKVTTAIGSSDDKVRAIALQSDGKIVVAGYTYNSNGDFVLARYNTAGSLDATFDVDGIVTLDFGVYDEGYAMKLNGNRIYVAGYTGSDFALAAFQNDNNTVLPLSLTAFTAAKQTGAVVLNWNTSSETTTSHFVVERSTDGSNFSSIATVQAAGNSTTTRQYTLTDTRSLDKAAYYRLRMVDLDGKYTYSKTLMIKGAQEAKALQVFPNPVRSVLQVQTSLSGALTLSLYNAGGSVVRQVQLTSNSPFASLPLDVSSLPKGVYRLNVQNGKSSEVISFVKE